jgi:hypothetical protein
MTISRHAIGARRTALADEMADLFMVKDGLHLIGIDLVAMMVMIVGDVMDELM